MLAPHQRAAAIPPTADHPWQTFLRARFIGALTASDTGAALGVVVHGVVPQSDEHAEISGLTERAMGDALPVVSAFTGSLHLVTREITLHQLQPEKTFTGRLAENGRVMSLREGRHGRPIHLVHEPTLVQLTT